ncbi:Lrp/AsnC family transcriptional regulator [Crossiella sp. SN42]|uniref:Lrp/AsnC family transcriptional regulator n=1 Tax=Crossiella sp. SN42 TaxID=2944808 RepID=UPI00207C252A|nr:Lrp/AsnC family transcriptional regulator [Crossiella sp. SN42]MCO1578852.1 Lrp/AsnC family transcriptional regulator [Crossiella sp. SN42]
MMDDTDRSLLAELQHDATQSYAALGAAVGLSAGAAHERVRKLKERGIIRRTTVEVDPAAVGAGVLSFVLVEAKAWMGEAATRKAFTAIPEVQEAHIVAGAASVMLKVRTGTTEELQDVLRRVFAVKGVSGTQTVMSLETMFERPVHCGHPGPVGAPG